MPHKKKEIINFDAEVDRTGVQALKFDGKMLESIFQEKDLWPSWVADMDFKASRHIQDALTRRVIDGVNPGLFAAVWQ
jgi:bifunctional pyridoxal-dependent enzyme with beta-cystathionase and maltose regulon repressor activities